MSWETYLTHWVDQLGGWVALSDALLHRATGVVDISTDPQSVERGLRRLARRGNKEGGQYGRWMLRFFGLPGDVATWLKWMGQYHSRFSDLPLALRAEQLELWDRAPMSDSSHAAWLFLGKASLYKRTRDQEATRQQLSRALARASAAGDEAVLEAKLLEARMASDKGDRQGCAAILDACQKILDESDALSWEDRLLYTSRLRDQLAYQLLHPEHGPPALDEAEVLYALIESGEDDALSFAAYQRHLGLAYCCWKRGALDTAASHCDAAVSHAGDGGFVRLRVIALNLWSRVIDETSDGPLRTRARRLASKLEDEDLLWRISR